MTIPYSRDFKLYVTTRLRNPLFSSELATKVKVINFLITPSGLDDQLLGVVTRKEKPELELLKDSLIVESDQNQRQLALIEDKILAILSASDGDLLEDETAVEALASSKAISAEIVERQEASRQAELAIDQTRDQYKKVAKHSSAIFFAVSDLTKIDPMYQFSLSWFVSLFEMVTSSLIRLRLFLTYRIFIFAFCSIKSIDMSEKSDSILTRISNLNSHFTDAIYQNVCQALFEKHKILFSFLLCISLMKLK